jgi:hypothetical protein
MVQPPKRFFKRPAAGDELQAEAPGQPMVPASGPSKCPPSDKQVLGQSSRELIPANPATRE